MINEKIMKSCEICGKSFTPPAKFNARTCGPSCRYALIGQINRKPRIIKICGYCKNTFETTREKTIFCSRICMLRARKGTHRMRPLKKKLCPCCGSLFVPQDREGRTKYCSYNCRRIGKSHSMKAALTGKEIVPRILRACPICGKTFKTTIKRDRKTCSYECKIKLFVKYHTKEPIIKNCGHCRVEFKAKYSKQIFCSPKCFGLSMRLRPKRSPAYIIKREEMKECSKCGYNRYPKILERHHIDLDRSNGKRENFNVLCPTCHDELHFLSKSGKFRKGPRNLIKFSTL